jgi:hypothetical protein
MHRIYLSKNPKALDIPVTGNTICIYHRYYAKILPWIDDCDFIEFKKFCDTSSKQDYFNRKQSVVFIGPNRMFNASSRNHPVFDILQYGLSGMERFVVDIAPYVGPLWRIFPHFSLAGLPFGEYTYSYLLESHYNSFQDGVRQDNPLDLESIREYARGNVHIEYDRFFSPPSIEVIPLPTSAHLAYQELKTDLFEENDNIAPIIKGLADFARSECKDRKIPQEHKIFETPDKIEIVRTDLKVDEYLTSQLVAKMDEVNQVCEVLK